MTFSPAMPSLWQNIPKRDKFAPALDLQSAIPPRGRGKCTGSFSLICLKIPTDNYISFVHLVTSPIRQHSPSKYECHKSGKRGLNRVNKNI